MPRFERHEARCLLPVFGMVSKCGYRPAYLRYAVLSFWHMFWLCLGLFMTVGIACRWGVVVVGMSVLALLAFDTAYVGITSRLSGFRRRVDARVAELARRAAAIARAALLRKMNNEHQQELLRLESLVDTMRDPRRPAIATDQAVLEACGTLLASYVRIAIRYRSGELCLSCVDGKQLHDDIFVLEHATCPESVRPHLERRIMVARQRAQRWDATRELLGPLQEQLRMIGDRIHLAMEEVNAIPAGICEVEHLRVVALDEGEMQLVRVEDDVDPLILALGRDVAVASTSSSEDSAVASSSDAREER